MLGVENLMNTSWWKVKDNIILGPEPQASQAGLEPRKEKVCAALDLLYVQVFDVSVWEVGNVYLVGYIHLYQVTIILSNQTH